MAAPPPPLTLVLPLALDGALLARVRRGDVSDALRSDGCTCCCEIRSPGNTVVDQKKIRAKNVVVLFVGAAMQLSGSGRGARSKRTKSGHSAHADDVSKGPSALTGEIGEGSSAVPKPSGQPWSTLRASAAVVPLRIGSPRASDASPWRLGLAPSTSCGGLPWPVELRRSVPLPSMKAGRSDLCTRYQHGSAGHSACFVTRVSELCRISLRLPHMGSGR